MNEWIKSMLSSDSNKSSARVINFIGAIAGTIILIYDTYLHGLNADGFAIYLAYCGGVYIGGKFLDKQGEYNGSNTNSIS